MPQVICRKSLFSSRCNSITDCADKSDEDDCDYLRFSPNYRNQLVPRNSDGTPHVVYVNVSIFALPRIDTFRMKYTVDFFLSLRWRDNRLKFRDLNNRTATNSLSGADLKAIWSPSISFLYSLGPYQTKVDEMVTAHLVRESDPLDEDFSTATEGIG